MCHKEGFIKFNWGGLAIFYPFFSFLTCGRGYKLVRTFKNSTYLVTLVFVTQKVLLLEIIFLTCCCVLGEVTQKQELRLFFINDPLKKY